MIVPLLWLPAINACLNATSALLLAAGFVAIYYHAHAGATRFAGVGWIRPVYFAILGTHTVLAVAILPLVAVTLARALRQRFSLHRRIARVTLPLWLYVSVTGVVVYAMLYHLYPSR